MVSPIKAQKKFPGNIGEGISSEADAKSKKNVSSITAPFMFFAFCRVLFLTDAQPRVSSIAIFNKLYRSQAQQKYKNKKAKSQKPNNSNSRKTK
jgi:hypothetical protein